MNQRLENRTEFLGTYFDRDGALRLARWAGILAWALLALYVYSTLVSVGQFLNLLISGAASYA